VALTGFMGAGKTCIGRALASLLGWTFIDLDHEIETNQERPIRDIFRLEGEPRFRELESQTLGRILRQVTASTVIALGGGTFIQAANAQLLREAGARVVLLETPIELMLQRCGFSLHPSPDNLRPLASHPAAFRALYAERLPQYRKADLTVETAGRMDEENAREIADRLQLQRDER